MFEILFSLDRGSCRIENFEINQLIYAVSSRVAFEELVFVFVDSPDKVTCHANI